MACFEPRHILMREGVTTHYFPLGSRGEKGIDVWLALEALELAIYKRFDVIVLIAGDGDFVPLVRKLNTIGARVLLLGWDFKYTDEINVERETRTSQMLLEEVTYPKQMHEVIDDRATRNSPLITSLFVPKSENNFRKNPVQIDRGPGAKGYSEGDILKLLSGFGFVSNGGREAGKELFFHSSSLLNAEFSELRVGDFVRYVVGSNDKGPCADGVEVSFSKS